MMSSESSDAKGQEQLPRNKIKEKLKNPQTIRCQKQSDTPITDYIHIICAPIIESNQSIV